MESLLDDAMKCKQTKMFKNGASVNRVVNRNVAMIYICINIAIYINSNIESRQKTNPEHQ